MKSYTKITARYAETDQMGIIHHSIYPIWYEVARTDFIKTMGMSYSHMEKIGLMLPLVEVNCRYIFPAKYEDEITIKTTIEMFSASRIKFLYELFNENGDMINSGSTLHAFTNLELKPINVKKYFKEIYDMLCSNSQSE